MPSTPATAEKLKKYEPFLGAMKTLEVECIAPPTFIISSSNGTVVSARGVGIREFGRKKQPV